MALLLVFSHCTFLVLIHLSGIYILVFILNFVSYYTYVPFIISSPPYFFSVFKIPSALTTYFRLSIMRFFFQLMIHPNLSLSLFFILILLLLKFINNFSTPRFLYLPIVSVLLLVFYMLILSSFIFIFIFHRVDHLLYLFC